MIKPTLEEISSALTRLGHKVFVNGELNLNLVGIRKDYAASNRFDDTFCVFAKEGGDWFIKHWPCTTDPGWYYLDNPAVKGTAILKEGQYLGAYEIGLHKGMSQALTQKKPVTVWRDTNKDRQLDKMTTDTGLFGINIHRANINQTSVNVDKWSAGCTVFANPYDFAELLELARRSEAIWGNSFTYTLIKEADL